ncbi:MAG: hypothetical protein QME92_00350 [Bacillota bacterium]|nr:hypothetical protein [Bacillota bacterium]
MSQFGAQPRGGVFAAMPGPGTDAGPRCVAERCNGRPFKRGDEFLGYVSRGARACGYGFSGDEVVTMVVSAKDPAGAMDC